MKPFRIGLYVQVAFISLLSAIKYWGIGLSSFDWATIVIALGVLPWIFVLIVMGTLAMWQIYEHDRINNKSVRS